MQKAMNKKIKMYMKNLKINKSSFEIKILQNKKQKNIEGG